MDEFIKDPWSWLGREAVEFGFRWLVMLAFTVGSVVLGALVFGRGYKKRIAALEARASMPAINQTFNFNVAADAHDHDRQLRNAIEAKTAHNLKETINSLSQHPLGDGYTYAQLPDGTNIVSMADGTVRLALPIRVSAGESSHEWSTSQPSVTHLRASEKDTCDDV